jgi:hypothetical protein
VEERVRASRRLGTIRGRMLRIALLMLGVIVALVRGAPRRFSPTIGGCGFGDE